jgi:hypothetical protein
MSNQAFSTACTEVVTKMAPVALRFAKAAVDPWPVVLLKAPGMTEMRSIVDALWVFASTLSGCGDHCSQLVIKNKYKSMVLVCRHPFSMLSG